MPERSPEGSAAIAGSYEYDAADRETFAGTPNSTRFAGNSTSRQDGEKVGKDVRALNKNECGVKDCLKATEPPVPSAERVMAKTASSEHELTRGFIEHLIQAGRTPLSRCPGTGFAMPRRNIPEDDCQPNLLAESSLLSNEGDE
jgi:hypothetical protein